MVDRGRVGGRAARAMRVLLLLLMALAGLEYLFGSILDASPFKTYLYQPIYNATQPTYKSKERLIWPKTLPNSQTTVNPSIQNVTHKETSSNNVTITIVVNKNVTGEPVKIENKTVTIENILLPNTSVNDSKRVTSSSLEDVTEEFGKNSSILYCDKNPPGLGPVTVNKAKISMSIVDKKYPEVSNGGWYKPPNCTARDKVAILVPYRNRESHLPIFLNHMHPFLMKQQIEYGIFIIEQQGNSAFNRAKLFNTGFTESNRLRDGGWDCFVFHDVDLLPLDERNLYNCPRQPRHMSSAIDKYRFKLQYTDIFGGVSSMTYEQFTRVNGFSNRYWGWGGEDDDMSYRLRKVGYHIARYKMSIARYTMLDHKQATPNPKRYQLLSQTSKNFLKDGLTTLKYELIQVIPYHLYTKVIVNVDEKS